MISTQKSRFTLVFALFLVAFTAQAQTFSKYFSFGMNNPMIGTTFTNCHELSNQNGYLLTAEKYTSSNVRNTMLIRTDTALNELWTTMLNFDMAAAPFDNINFSNVGELLNGNYYVYAETGIVTRPVYVIFVFDTSGNVIHYTAINDTLNISHGNVLPLLTIAEDSSIIISITEYDRFGFYRLDQQLNLISSGIYRTISTYGRGRHCLLLPDTTLLFNGESNGLVLTKTTTAGAILWSKRYPSIGNAFSLCRMGNSIYAGGAYVPNSASGYVAKFDTSGTLIWYHTFLMANSSTMSAIWNIYPDGNNLMLYSDSIMFEIDTLGFPIGNGFTVNSSNNYKVLKPSSSNEFMLAGPIFQDAVQDYRHTLMRFNMNTVSTCLTPRALVTTVSASSMLSIQLTSIPHFIQTETIDYSDTTLQLGYDKWNGCVPTGINENSESLHTPSVFPNPAADVLTIGYTPKDRNAKLVVEITDVTGRVTRSEALQLNAENKFNLSVSALAEGMYTVSVYENGNAAGHVLCCVKH
jgi:hypothetical protein